MVSDQDIAKGVESLLRHSDPNSITTVNGVVQQLEAKLGLDLSHKASFIRDQIDLLLRTQSQPFVPHPPLNKDYFAPYPQPHFPITHFPSHFALHDEINFQHPPPPCKVDAFPQNADAVAPPQLPKESVQTGGKRRGGAGGLNKVCGVSPELQAVVGEPALPRTEIVRQLWAYIKKNNLQDPGNKRKIICDDALRLVFETDCTDMFKMNQLLAKHIIPLGPTKESQAKRVKVEAEIKVESAEPASSNVVISEALAKFLGTEGREMQQSEAIRLVWEYIKLHHLEDPLNAMVILCDAKLQELLGCESISALGIPEMLARHHLFKQSDTWHDPHRASVICFYLLLDQ
ncbi:spp27 [Mucuna pruriens]|uniref:Spp27 n=1 Tax=Mucuna pruriens TaxID=157652 RepID=A0A371EZ43_MUCPR|nr:spp27 [Mucuna pruriens]